MTEIIKDYGIIKLIPKRDLAKVYVEITSKCNFDCVMCVRKTWKDEIGSMTRDQFYGLLDQMKGFPGLSTIHFGGFGEPLCHENLGDFLDGAAEAGLEIELTTNASLLNREMAERIIERQVKRLTVSIDSAVEEKFNDIRGYDLKVILDNLKGLHALKKEKRSKYPRVGIAFVMMRDNVDDLVKLSGLGKDIGAEYFLVSQLLPHTEEMKDQICYGQSDSGFAIDKSVLPDLVTQWPESGLKTERRCPFLTPKACVVSWNGNVSPCLNFAHTYSCFILGRKKDIKRVSFGNVFESSLVDIWTSPAYLRFRWNLAEFRFSSCADCNYNNGCYFTKSNEGDCWANSPTCSDCLYSRRILRCP
jgi:tungsten cofactor oxidoreducase radical SAM maturase